MSYPYEERCQCVECEDSATACHMDCERCQGCLEAKDDQEAVKYDADVIWGRR